MPISVVHYQNSTAIKGGNTQLKTCIRLIWWVYFFADKIKFFNFWESNCRFITNSLSRVINIQTLIKMMLFPNFKIVFWKIRSFLKFFKIKKKRKLIDNLSKWSSIFWSGLFHYFPPSSHPSGAAWTIQWSTKHEKCAKQFQKWNRPFWVPPSYCGFIFV